MGLLRSLNALVHVIFCLTHEEPDKMMEKRNSLSYSIILTAHLSLYCMDRDFRSHNCAVDETLEI